MLLFAFPGGIVGALQALILRCEGGAMLEVRDIRKSFNGLRRLPASVSAAEQVSRR